MCPKKRPPFRNRSNIEAYALTTRYTKMSENRLREGAAALEKAYATNRGKQAGKDKAGEGVNFVK
jgi:hypothetical protein